jgi:hypothetical protein
MRGSKGDGYAGVKPRLVQEASEARPEAGDGDEWEPPPTLGQGNGDSDGGAAEGG